MLDSHKCSSAATRRGYRLATPAALLGTVLVCATVAQADPLPWTSTSFSGSSDSMKGRCGNIWASLPCAIVNEGADANSAASVLPPMPGPTDADSLGTLAVDGTSALDCPGNGLNYNCRIGSASGREIGDPSGTISTGSFGVSASAYVQNNNAVNVIRAAHGRETLQFVGEFPSTGTSLDVSFAALYNLLAFNLHYA